MSNNYGGRREGSGRKSKKNSEKAVTFSFTTSPGGAEILRKRIELSGYSKQSHYIKNRLKIDDKNIIPGVVYAVYEYNREENSPEADLINSYESIYEAMGLCVSLNDSAMIMAVTEDGFDELWNDFWYKEDVIYNRNKPGWDYSGMDAESKTYHAEIIKNIEKLK